MVKHRLGHGAIAVTVTVALALAAGAVGCSSSQSRTTTSASDSSAGSTSLSDTTSDSTPSSTSRTDAPTLSPDVRAGVLAGLSSAGIVVHADNDYGVPPRGIVYSQFQADALAAEVEAGGGVTGEWLRTNFALPDDVRPIDVIISTWLLVGTSPASESARGIVDTSSIVDPDTMVSDPAGFVFPWAVLAMFTNDVAMSSASLPDAGPSRVVHGDAPRTVPPAPPKPTSGALASLCTAAQDEYNAASKAVSDAIAGAPFLGELAEWVGGAVRFPGKNGPSPLGTAVKALSDFAKKALSIVANGIAAASQIADALQAWQVIVIPDNATVQNNVRAGQTGTFNARLLTITQDWPDYVKACAQLAGVELPNITPSGSPVKWAVATGAHATIDNAETVIAEDEYGYSSTVGFTVLADPPDATEEHTELFSVMATVVRSSKEALQSIVKVLIDAVLAPVPQLVRDLIAGVVASAGSQLIIVKDAINTSQVIGVKYKTTSEPSTTDSTPHSDPLQTTTTTDPLAGCIDAALVSNATTVGLSVAPSGMVLQLNSDGTGIFDFTNAQPSSSTSGDGGTVVFVVFAGALNFTWTRTDQTFHGTLTSSTLTLKATVQTAGLTVDVPIDDPGFLTFGGVSDEQLVCTGGVVTVSRTGQTFG